MKTRKLTEAEYKSTFSEDMNDVTDDAYPVVDIWDYVKMLKNEGEVLKYVYRKKLVEIVYRNNEGTFDHVLLPTDKSNCFVVITVNRNNKNIFGHYILDLNDKYQVN